MSETTGIMFESELFFTSLMRFSQHSSFDPTLKHTGHSGSVIRRNVALAVCGAIYKLSPDLL